MTKPPPPDIVLILADDMGFSDIGCFGSEIQTPVLDRLAASGLRFSQLYNTSRCCPSRASILTGLSPHQAGIGHMVDDWNVGPAYQGWLRDDTVTLAEALKASDYRCLYSGKWHVNWSFDTDPGQASDSLHERLGTPGYPHPMQRGFDDAYTLMAGATSLFNPQHLLRKDQWVNPDQPGYYFTDAITDEAIRMIDAGDDTERPLFLHLSHVAPHWPLHALPEDIQKYADTYAAGWDVLRESRHARLRDLGIIDRRWLCSERDPWAPAWDSLTPERQQWEAQRMAVYAAMVDRLDQSVGRLVDHLKARGTFENTLILFLSDNGGCAEFLHEDGWCQWYDHPTWDGRPMRLGNDMSIEPGPDDTYMSYDLPWANASNTPFRLFKHFVHEGGISTPALISWPRGIADSGLRHTPWHVQDIMPTLLELAGAECPQVREGQAVQPLEGESFASALSDPGVRRTAPICFEHEGNCAIRSHQYKAVRRHPGDWELYDMDADRTETNDLAQEKPDVLQQLRSEYARWAQRCGVREWPPGEWPEWMSTDELRNST